MRWSKTLSIVDCHAEGEVGKVIVGGVGQVPGDTMFDKKLYLEAHRDDLRKLVLFEPRGAAWHNANIILPSNNPAAAMGYIILESTEYPAMSGSNTICVATVLLETGILPMQEPITNLTLEAPAGLIHVRCECRDGKVTSVRLVNQPAFCYHLDAKIEVTGLGTVTVDVAYGGMTFAIVDGTTLGFDIVPSEARQICELGEKIKAAAAEQLAVAYPGNPDMPGITITEVTAPLRRGERPDRVAQHLRRIARTMRSLAMRDRLLGPARRDARQGADSGRRHFRARIDNGQPLHLRHRG